MGITQQISTSSSSSGPPSTPVKSVLPSLATLKEGTSPKEGLKRGFSSSFHPFPFCEVRWSFTGGLMAAEGLKQVLARPIHLADQVSKLAVEVNGSRPDCLELKSKADKLSALLRQAARVDLYDRPTRRIMDNATQVLEKALALVSNYRSQQSNVVRRVFTPVPAAAFKKMSSLLDNSVSDVSWLLRVSTTSDEDDSGWLGLAPIAANEPYLCFIWEQIAKLQKGNEEAKAEAAASLVSFAEDNDRYGKLIVEEGGIPPLLRALKEDMNVKAQESAARALGVLGSDPENVKAMVEIGAGGVCPVFSKVLKEGDMKVQALVASAVAEFVDWYPASKEMFAQNHVVRVLVGHLAFETLQEHSKYISYLRMNSGRSESVEAKTIFTNCEDGKLTVKHPAARQNQEGMIHSVVQSTIAKQNHHHHQSSVGRRKGRENEDPSVKAQLKAMAARALWKLAKGNPAICKTITESRALMCFAVLLKNGPDEVRYNSAMAVMEIARVAEQDAELRRSAFNPSSPATKTVVDQLVRIVENADHSDILVPCIVTLGCLSKTFRATENRIIVNLVHLLDDKESNLVDVTKEAVVALTKFACTDNYLHKDHSKAIIAEGGVKHLVQLVYFGEKETQIPALILLCYIAFHVPDSEELARSGVLSVLEWASKHNLSVQNAIADALLPDTKSRLELYQSRSSNNFY